MAERKPLTDKRQILVSAPLHGSEPMFCVRRPFTHCEKVQGVSLVLHVPLRGESECFQYEAVTVCVTKRRSGWACIGNPKVEQETIEGTHAQETPGHQRRPTTQHEVQGSNPPIRALYMQRAKIPQTHHTTPCATIAPGADKPARHPPRAQQVPSQHTHN